MAQCFAFMMLFMLCSIYIVISILRKALFFLLSSVDFYMHVNIQ